MVKFLITKFLGKKANVKSCCSGKFSESLQPWHKFTQHWGLSLLFREVTDLMTEPWGCQQPYTLRKSIIDHLILHVKKKKIKALKALAISLTLRLLVLVVWSHIPGVSMQHHFNDHAASSERSCFWFSGWYQYEKCCCFPQIRYRKLKHPQGRFNRTDLQDSFGYKTPHSNGQVHTALSKMDNQQGPAA